MREKSIQEKLKAYFEGTSLGLPSFEFYRNLDRHFFNYNDINKNFLISLNERNEYKNLCEDINSDNKNSWYKRLCVVLLMVLKTTGTKISKKDNDYDDCKLLNYWIYDKLDWISKGNYGKTIYNFGNLQILWNQLIEDSGYQSFYNKCSPDFYMPTHDDWRQRKGLYDFCVDYETIVKIGKNYETKRKYINNYILKKSQLNNFFNKICPDDNDKYPELCKKCKEYLPINALREIQTYTGIESKGSIGSAVRSESKIRDIAGNVSEDVLAIKPDGTFLSSPEGDHLSFNVHALDDDSSQSMYGIELFPDSFINSDTFSIVYILGKAFIGLALFTMISILFYKFTPLGIIIRRAAGWEKNIMCKAYRDHGMFKDYALESCIPKTMNREEHYIGYRHQ